MASAQHTELSLPVVIHYLQSESSRYERERNYWELERAEMKARIAKVCCSEGAINTQLEGERKSNERMKDWYQRRLKMMENALFDERKKTDPHAKPSPAFSDAMPETKKKENARSRIEHDDKYMDIVSHAQESLRLQDGRTKSRSFLEKCLTEVTYLVNANPTITANRPVRLNQVFDDNIQDVQREPIHMQSARRPLSPDNVPIRRPSPAPILPGEALNTSIPLDEVAMEDLEQIEKIQHTFDANGRFIEVVPERNSEAWGKADDAWDFGESAAPVTKKETSQSSFNVVATMTGHLDSIYSVTTLVVDGDLWIASGGADSTIQLHANTSPSAVATLRDHTGVVHSVLFDAGTTQPEQCIYSAGEDMVIRKWTINLRNIEKFGDVIKPAVTMISHSAPVVSLAMIDGGLLSASTDGSVRLWDTETGISTKNWWSPQSDSAIWPTSLCVVWTHRFAAGYTDGTIRIFSTADGTGEGALTTIQTKCRVNTLYMLNDTLLSGHEDGTIATWSRSDNWAPTQVINAHTDAVTSLCGRPNSNTDFASVSNDCSTRIWSLPDTSIQEFTSHREKGSLGVCSVTWTTGYLGEEILLTAGVDGVLKQSQRET